MHWKIPHVTCEDIAEQFPKAFLNVTAKDAVDKIMDDFGEDDETTQTTLIKVGKE